MKISFMQMSRQKDCIGFIIPTADNRYAIQPMHDLSILSYLSDEESHISTEVCRIDVDKHKHVYLIRDITSESPSGFDLFDNLWEAIDTLVDFNE